ncbi:MAG: thiamine pyrophosphate-binding protein [Actinobacteria bacterium]|nr:thiamine pyrophosphate-binding protein [Actinomycetota bacterium]
MTGTFRPSLAREPLDAGSWPAADSVPAAPPAGGTRYGADLIVDQLIAHGIEYVALNPGASFRGLHDSLVNYGQGRPEMILCPHEEIAVAIAHGYAKAHGPAKPMAAILHDVVGLLNGSMAMYVAYADRIPIVVLGGTGPMNEAKRRPRVDWVHTANVQGNAVRDFVKWDDQPATVDSIADSFARAYRVAVTEPQGPVYVCYDAQLQEDPLPSGYVPGPTHPTALPSRMAPDPQALERAADLLVSAERPVIVAQFLGRDPAAVDALVRLAEGLGAPVVDLHHRLNFPTAHPLNLTGSDVLAEADLVLALDVRHPDLAAFRSESATRVKRRIVPAEARWVEIGFSDVEISKWATEYGQLQRTELSVLADTSLAVPSLADLVADRLRADRARADRARLRAASLAGRHRALRDGWARRAREDWDAVPMTTGRLALEVWDAVKDEDWVVSAGTLEGRIHQLWDMDRPYRHPGERLGPGTQIGISLGVALAHRGTGRVVVDLQPDGDLMYDDGAIWVAAKYEIPILIVMFNNRAYYNDWQHQVAIAKHRGTPVERARIGQDISGPAPDFAALARSMGCYGEGPIEDPRALGPALRRAIAQVKDGRPALVDAVTRFR